MNRFFSLVYTNDLPDGIQSICKLFADDASCFPKRQDLKKPERDLNKDLTIIKKWVFQWKMDFNPDPKKQVIEVCFSRKIVSKNSKPLSSNQS